MHLITNIARIIIIDLALSGDNALLIGMAAHRLPPHKRKKAILIGGAGAIGLRIVLTIIAAMLLQVPGLELTGGLLLIWIGFRLLQQPDSQKNVKAASSMKEAIITILVADFIMSTDNVLGVAGASEGNIALLLFGLVLSMAILMFMGSLVVELLNRFWWLAYVGSGVIVWTGTLMFIRDPLVGRYLAFVLGISAHVYAVTVTAGTLAAAHWYYRMRTPKPRS